MTLEQATTLESLPDDLIARPVTLDDLDAYVTFAHAREIEEYGYTSTQAADVRNEWTLDDFDLAHSTRAVFTPDGQMVGFAELWDVGEMPVRPYLFARTHPAWHGKGIGTALFQWAEARAREVFARVPADAKVTLNSGCKESYAPSNQHLQNMGMTTNRQGLEMLIEMDAAPPAPVWPDGITVTTAAAFNNLRAVYEAIEAAFQDHRGYVQEDPDESFRRFKHWATGDELYDPAQWFLAMDGDRIAGCSLCRAKSWEDPNSAYVMELGVLRDYRRKGLGLALLHHTFGEYWRRGERRVTLHVDGSSLTNATRLYERAGMHVSKAHNHYEKVLRDGKEYSNQGE